MQIRDALTERELELVKLAALGMRNRHIGWVADGFHGRQGETLVRRDL
jgi:hypothetical protein